MLGHARSLRSTVAGVALAVVSFVASGAGTLAQVSGPVRIAVFGPMTGLYAATGKQIWTGAKQCGDEINAAGGVLGAQLELVQTDDEGDPGKGTLAAQKMADDPSVVATLGWLNSSVAIPTSDIFAPLNLAMISVGATNPVLTARGHANVFRVVADDDYQAPAQYLYLKKAFSPTKIALVDESTELTVLMNDRIQILTDQDQVETSRYSIRPQDKDFRAVLGTIPQDVDAMIVNTGPGPLALWVQQAEELGFDVPMVGNDSTLDPVQYIEAAAGAAEGNLVTSGAPDSSVIPSAADFVTKYKELYQEASLRVRARGLRCGPGHGRRDRARRQHRSRCHRAGPARYVRGNPPRPGLLRRVRQPRGRPDVHLQGGRRRFRDGRHHHRPGEGQVARRLRRSRAPLVA